MSWWHPRGNADVQLSPPAAPGDFADPYVVFTGEQYMAYATASGDRHIQVRASYDLLAWTELPDALPELAHWSKPGRTWSPAVLQAEGRWALWYATVEPASGHQALSVAQSDRPDGPFVDSSTGPAIFQAELGGSIDPSVFCDEDGPKYLVWKADSNAIHRRSSLWAQLLCQDGITLQGEPVRLLTFNRWWERPLIEAPSMFGAEGEYFLFYSAGRWDSPNYAIGLARATHPLGPWTKISAHRPWASSDSAAAGPGGQEVFRTADGGLMLAYHAWEPGRTTYRSGGVRSLRLGRLAVKPDGLSIAISATRARDSHNQGGPTPT